MATEISTVILGLGIPFICKFAGMPGQKWRNVGKHGVPAIKMKRIKNEKAKIVIQMIRELVGVPIIVILLH